MTRHLRKFGWRVGVILFLAGAGTPVALSAEFKIGSVDLQRAVNECNAGKEAKKSIMAQFEKIQKQGADKQKELQAMREALEKQAPMLTKEARATKEKDLQTRGKEFQRWAEDSQNELNQKRIEMERSIAQGIFQVVQKIGSDEGFTVILEKNEQVVLYTTKAIDITDRVIKAYDVQKK